MRPPLLLAVEAFRQRATVFTIRGGILAPRAQQVAANMGNQDLLHRARAVFCLALHAPDRSAAISAATRAG